MKKPLIALLLLFTTIGLKAQQQVLFKLRYSPSRNYASMVKMNMDLEMNMDGDTATLNKMKKSGRSPFPMVMKMDIEGNMNTVTSALNADKSINFIINNSRLSKTRLLMNGKETSVPVPASKEIIYGKCTAEGKMDIDSISGKRMTDSIKAAVLKSINTVLANVKFPETPMKIGDTFVQDIPMDMNMGMMSAKAISKATYKLTGIENGKAYFDVNHVMTIDVAGEKNKVKVNVDMTGGGDGKMIYDIANSYPSDIKNNLSLIFAVAVPQEPKVKMNGKANISSDIQITITAK